jgi:hypothetical protein
VLKFGACNDITFTHDGASEATITQRRCMKDLDILDAAAGTTFSSSINLALDAHLDSTPGDEKVSGITATFTAGEAFGQRRSCIF